MDANAEIETSTESVETQVATSKTPEGKSTLGKAGEYFRGIGRHLKYNVAGAEPKEDKASNPGSQSQVEPKRIPQKMREIYEEPQNLPKALKGLPSEFFK